MTKSRVLNSLRVGHLSFSPRNFALIKESVGEKVVQLKSREFCSVAFTAL